MTKDQNPNRKQNIDCKVGEKDKDGDQLLARCEILNGRIIELWKNHEGPKISPFSIGTRLFGKKKYTKTHCWDEDGAISWCVFTSLVQFELPSK